MAKEYEFIMKNDVWDVVSSPKGKSIMNSRWLYKIKCGVDGSIKNYFFKVFEVYRPKIPKMMITQVISL